MNNGIRIAIIVVAIAAAIFAVTQYDLLAEAQRFLRWVRGNGAVGVLVFMVIYIIAPLSLLPGSILTLGAGIIFGVFWGSVYVSIAATIGAALAFLIGRYIARDWVSQKISAYPKFKAIDDAVAGQGWKIVFLTRLSPIFPFTILNYAFGITQVRFRDYFSASWLGMIPGTIMYVYIGSLIGDIGDLGKSRGERTTVDWVIYGVGFVATVAVTLYITKVAKEALQQKTDIDDVRETEAAK